MKPTAKLRLYSNNTIIPRGLKTTRLQKHCCVTIFIVVSAHSGDTATHKRTYRSHPLEFLCNNIAVQRLVSLANVGGRPEFAAKEHESLRAAPALLLTQANASPSFHQALRMASTPEAVLDVHLRHGRRDI
jgi:hypothetical protein